MTLLRPRLLTGSPRLQGTEASAGPQRGGPLQARPLQARLYYLHPLLAGPIADWPRHFARVRLLGFSHVVVAPPFRPGPSGNLFVTADHDRLHPALGQQDAEAGLRAAARAAGDHGLKLVLDLVVDRVASNALLARMFADRNIRDADAPPDPRIPPELRHAASLHFDADGALLDWWQQRLATWLDTGIAGFRCLDPTNVDAAVWTGLVAAARARRDDALMIAWVQAAAPDRVRALQPSGFDLAASSSWAWDMRADWLDADTRRIAAIGGLLAMPEAPFGPRLAASQRHPEAAGRRALDFAGAFGDAWLMPMGFEYGARNKLDRARGTPAAFAALADAAEFDLSGDIAAVNARQRGLQGAGPPMMISRAGARVAAFARSGADATLILVNTELERASSVPLAELRLQLDGACIPPAQATELAPGEVRLVQLSDPRPIIIPAPEGGAARAIGAPRMAIEAVTPSVEDGRFPAKRIVGETVQVEADIICDGHEKLAASLHWRAADDAAWTQTRMAELGNDRWAARFTLDRPGRYEFIVEAWEDVFGSFRYAVTKKHGAGLNLDLELREGLAHVQEAAHRSPELGRIAAELADAPADRRLEVLMSARTAELMDDADTRPFAIRSPAPYGVDAERVAAGFASWYEIFPRSQSPMPGRHGNFDDVIARLPAIADMGFDVLYFPPIHPIGRINRKGRNNSLTPTPDDPGSPYATGAQEGGHDAVHPELGTLEDFRRLVAAAHQQGLEIALDFAIQCSPDHPWLREHPDWFSWRPDGSIRYAENPPKKYEDIVNVAFYAEAAMPSLWVALRDVVQFWVDQGVRLFRVDNPHTKPFPFWEWLIGDIRSRHPDVVFLAEAFTRPKVMYRLAKIGFSQSYTYFTWRNTAWELREYLQELTTTAPKDFFRPHFFVNTPDINPIFLHDSGRPGFLLRAALAATLSGLWGVYNGFELCESQALPGREEYLNSEKYEIRSWDHDRPGNIVDEIRQLNHIRRTNPALHSHLGVTFLACPNENVLCYAKIAGDNIVVAVVSFDPRQPQEVDFELPAKLLGVPDNTVLRTEDLMRGGVGEWRTGWRHHRIDPADLPFALWRLRPLAEG
jgi:starch synthase (maltosyl-transferring)